MQDVSLPFPSPGGAISTKQQGYLTVFARYQVWIVALLKGPYDVLRYRAQIDWIQEGTRWCGR